MSSLECLKPFFLLGHQGLIAPTRGNQHAASGAMMPVSSMPRFIWVCTPCVAHHCRYAHVNATCLEQAPLARWYREFEAAGGRFEDMVVHLEPAADFDGLAVFWGIGNTKTTAEECAKHCWEHRPHTVGGEQLPKALRGSQHCPRCSMCGIAAGRVMMCSA